MQQTPGQISLIHGSDLPRLLRGHFFFFPKASVKRLLTSPPTVIRTSKSSSQHDSQPQKEKEPSEVSTPLSLLAWVPDRDLAHQGFTIARLRTIPCFASSHK